MLIFAFGAEPEEIKTVIIDFISRPVGHLQSQVFHGRKLRISDGTAPGADQMRMRVWFVTVVSAASVGEAQLQNLAQLL